MIGAILFGVSALLGVGSSLASAKQQSTEAKYNEQLKREQAKMIGEKRKIVASQWDREISRASGTAMVNIAKSGVAFSGSPITALLDLNKQMEMDKAISDFNLAWEQQGVISQAENYRRGAKNAMYTGYANAFKGLLSAGYGAYNAFGVGSSGVNSGVNTNTGTWTSPTGQRLNYR